MSLPHAINNPMSTAHKSENMPSLGSCLDVSAALGSALEIPVYHQGASVAWKNGDD